jgi:DNA invertase Pin-like site-specific DNA recombinase
MKVEYIRWSTLQQSGSRQLLDSKNYDLILQEQISGSIAFENRPKGKELLALIEDGKVTDLFVEEFSRLGRNALDVLNTLNFCGDHCPSPLNDWTKIENQFSHLNLGLCQSDNAGSFL